MYHIFIYSSVGHLVRFYVLATVDSAAEADVLYTIDTMYKIDNWKPTV